MPREFINPETLSRPNGYTHAVVVPTGRMVFVSGQVAFNKDGSVAGKGDVEAQGRKAYENVEAALAAAGVKMSDVVRLTTYIVDYQLEYRELLRNIRAKYWSDSKPPAATLLGVQALALPDLLVEVEATAVVNDS